MTELISVRYRSDGSWLQAGFETVEAADAFAEAWDGPVDVHTGTIVT